MRVQRLAATPFFAPDWPKILDLVLWDLNQQIYQIPSKSEVVAFNPLGDLTRTDPYRSCHLMYIFKNKFNII